MLIIEKIMETWPLLHQRAKGPRFSSAKQLVGEHSERVLSRRTSEPTWRPSSHVADGGSREQHFPQREQPVLRCRGRRENFKGSLQV